MAHRVNSANALPGMHFYEVSRTEREAVLLVLFEQCGTNYRRLTFCGLIPGSTWK